MFAHHEQIGVDRFYISIEKLHGIAPFDHARCIGNSHKIIQCANAPGVRFLTIDIDGAFDETIRFQARGEWSFIRVEDVHLLSPREELGPVEHGFRAG
jgi:hypothetical protein